MTISHLTLGIAISTAAGLSLSAAARQPIDTSASDDAALVQALSETSPRAPISTDRPSFSDGTGIQPKYTLNLETGVTFTYRDRDDLETTRVNGPEVLARFGLIEDRLEVRVIWSGYSWARTDDGTEEDDTDGFTDIAMGAKFKLIDQQKWIPRLAIGVQSTLGGGSDDVSTQIAEPTFKLLWSSDLSQICGDGWAGVTLGGNANIAFPTTDSDRFTQGQGSIYLSFPLFDRATGFIEYFVVGPVAKDGDTAHSVDLGGVYLLTDRVQLDARVGFGLNEQSDNVFAGVGVSVMF